MKALIAIFIISIAVFIVGMALVFPGDFPLCEKKPGYPACLEKYNQYEMQGMLLAVLSPLLFFISMLVVAFRKARPVFKAWGKFAMVYLPISAVILYLVAGEQGGGIGFAAVDGEIIVWFISFLFFFISIIILAVKSWKLRQETSKLV